MVSHATGPNGHLNVLVCLRWWRNALRDDTDVGGWDTAVADVKWALEQLAAARKAAATTEAAPEGTSTSG